MASCHFAELVRMDKRQADVESMVQVIQFAEDKQKGNITVARKDANAYRKEYKMLHRV